MEIDLTGLVLPDRIEIAQISDDGQSAEFVMEPLERGYGHTLGNSIRRVLLSSLRGSAIWGFRIDGVVHEHQTIPSVVEDVHQVIQNLKSMVVVLDEDVDEATLSVSATKAGPVTAAQVRAPGWATVLDPDHHLLTLQEDRELNAEFFVNKGRGFKLADQHELPSDATVDLVRIDAIYNPVLRANFTVEETRVGQRTDFDRLTLRVETNGSVDPDSAVKYAAALVRKHFGYMLRFSESGPPASPALPSYPSARVPEDLETLLTTPVNDLTELKARSRNVLVTKGIDTLLDLVSCSEADLLEAQNFGEKSLDELVEFLRGYGLRLGMKIEKREDGLYFVDPKAYDSSEPGSAGAEEPAAVDGHRVEATGEKAGGPPASQAEPPHPSARVPKELAELLETPINNLAELKARPRNVLFAADLETLLDLVSCSKAELLRVPKFGEKLLDELMDFLRGHGLRLGMKFEKREDGLYVVDSEADDSSEPGSAGEEEPAAVEGDQAEATGEEEGGPPASQTEPPHPSAPESPLAELLETPIKDLAELNARLRNVLVATDLETLGDLVSRSETELLQVPNLGEKLLDELMDFLRGHGLRLGMKATGEEAVAAAASGEGSGAA